MLVLCLFITFFSPSSSASSNPFGNGIVLCFSSSLKLIRLVLNGSAMSSYHKLEDPLDGELPCNQNRSYLPWTRAVLCVAPLLVLASFVGVLAFRPTEITLRSPPSPGIQGASDVPHSDLVIPTFFDNDLKYQSLEVSPDVYLEDLTPNKGLLVRTDPSGYAHAFGHVHVPPIALLGTSQIHASAFGSYTLQRDGVQVILQPGKKARKALPAFPQRNIIIHNWVARRRSLC